MNFKKWWKKLDYYKKIIIATLIISLGFFYIWYFISTLGNIIQKGYLTCFGFGGTPRCSLLQFVMLFFIHTLVFLLAVTVPLILIVLIGYAILKFIFIRWKK